jgi:cell filamentation protein
MDSKYEYEFDPIYCYPNSSVLINKFHVIDEALFEKLERELTSLRIAQALKYGIAGNFDLVHLKQIHRFIFGDIFSWAGELRKVNISKGCMFCLHEYIEPELTKIFKKLKQEHYLRHALGVEIPKRMAYYFSEINAIHPFREGNGRTQRIFIEHLARYLGFRLDIKSITREEMYAASVESFQQNYAPMEEIFIRCLKKL